MRTDRRFPLPMLAGVFLASLWVTALVARTSTDTPSSDYRAGAVAAGQGTGAGAGAQKPAPGTGKPATEGQKPAPGPPDQPAAGAGDFVNDDETCLTCHEEQKKGYSTTMHGRKDHPRSPAAKQGCETCHGPGQRHVDDPEAPGLIRAFEKEPPRDANAVCLTCHERRDHALWEGSVHDSRNLSCVTCHSVHEFKSEHAQLKTVREMDTCARCHREKVARIDRSGHMPLREGKMECSTCHNPHGSTNVRQLRKGDSIGEMCTACHADKRGPYLWEHAPSRDGCVTCHDPHGSPNERMLVTKTPILCQRCHVMTRHPSTIYDAGLIGSGATPSVRIFARSCITCHSAIHGSNHPSGQRFTR